MPPTAPKGSSSIRGAYIQDPDFTLYNGDALEVLKTLPDESVHCCVTSPPYWGLRDYGSEGQVGLEPTPDAYIAKMVEVFREVRRVLRKDGTCWLNIGDSYAGSWGAQSRGNTTGEAKSRIEGTSMLSARQIASHPLGLTEAGSLKRTPGLKPKDLCMIPARLALALQADGWYLRSQIVWSKPNPMPESVTDRPTTAHEFVYLLTRSPRYFFDQEAVREKAEWAHWGEQTTPKYGDPNGGTKASWIGQRGVRDRTLLADSGRNLRSVWEIATEPFPEAHFATYPQELVRRCILAGTSERGCCPECGTPWIRQVITTYDAEGRTTNGPRSTERRHESPGRDVRMVKDVETTGWHPRCECGRRIEEGARPVAVAVGDNSPGSSGPVLCTTTPAVVLDPFCGSGTTALVARKHGRKCIGIELSADYCALAAKRTSQLSLEAEAV